MDSDDRGGMAADDDDDKTDSYVGTSTTTSSLPPCKVSSTMGLIGNTDDTGVVEVARTVDSTTLVASISSCSD